MEAGDTDKSPQGEDVAMLSRNRSFKSKQLVRSQAIRETHSPPPALSPKVADEVPANVRTFCESVVVTSNHYNSDKRDADAAERKTQPVEIQITSNTSWAQESPNHTDQRQRARRWLGTKQNSDSISDLLSNSPRVTCVCGNCKMRPRLDDLSTRICPNCRGRRRKFPCPTKQDSGIVCEEECLDCSDTTLRNESLQHNKKVESLDKVQMEHTYCSCPVNKETNNDKMNDFDEKKELTGAELIEFFKETLNKSAKDRSTLLKIEKDLHTFVTDPGRTLIRFPAMSSYHRMLVHRCASLFDLAHGADSIRGVVMVSKCGTSGGRITCTDFNDWCTTVFPEEETGSVELQAKSILKRDALSLDETNGGSSPQCMSARSKSLEQREKEYEQTRRRIFSSEMTSCNQEESQCPWLQSGNFKLLTPENGRNKLVKGQSLETPVASQSRGAVSKSHSFGGYEPPPPTRVLSRQGDLASSSWRLSPSSSGYKTLSLRSTDSVTPSPTGDISPEPNSVVNQAPNELPLVWAISDVSSIPIGALIIHPQTGCPLTNSDGSLYHYHPANPPIFQDMQLQHNTDQNSEKKRGRLEKQHSFMENEYECPNETFNTEKCECSDKLDWCEDRTPEKCHLCENNDKQEKIQTDQAPGANQPSPNVQYKAIETSTPISTNKKPPQMEPTNQQSEPSYAEKNYEQYSLEHQSLKQESVPVSEEVSVDVKTAEAVYTDHTMEQMALQVYPAPVHQQSNYTYPAQCRMDHIQQPIYTQIPEETKVMNTGLHEPTFRIDPTYPYHPQAIQDIGGNMGYVPNYGYHLTTCNGCCGVDAISGINNCVLSAQRSYAVPYTQNMDTNVIQPMTNPYPMTNLLLTHQPVQYPYTPSIQYPVMPHLQTPLTKPVASQNVYMPQEIPMYPQMDNIPAQMYPLLYQNYQLPYTILQQHSMCPVYPVLERDRPRNYEQKFASKKNSVCGSSRATPLESGQQDLKSTTNHYENKFNKQNSFNEADGRRKPFVRTNSLRNETPQQRESPNEITAKIQQIKQQMAQLSTADKGEKKFSEKPKAYEERRNRNPGILGSYPNNNQFNRLPRSDESHLNSAARALVNSLRQNLQVKNTYPAETRRDYHSNGGRYYKNDYDRYRRDRRDTEYMQNREYTERQDNNNNGEVKMQNSYDRNRTPDTERTNHLRFEQHPMYRSRPVNPVTPFYRPFMFRQMTPPWCRRSPAPITQTYGHPRRPPPENRNGRRQ